MNIREIPSRIAERIDNIFLISPSFFAIVSGGFISMATGLLIELLSIEERQIKIFLILATLGLFISSVSLIYTSIVVERLHKKAEGKKLRDKIYDHRKKLWFSFLVGFVGVIPLAYGIVMGINLK